MSRTVYDDWNITGNNQERNLPGSVPYNAKTNSLIFVVSVSFLVILGLICQYSASYPIAVSNGLDNYSYFLRQLIFTCAGLVAGALIIMMSEKMLKVLCPIFMILCLIVLFMNFFIKSEVLISNNMIGVVFYAQILYLALFFANRTNEILRLRELFIPLLFSILFLIVILLQKNFAYALIFLLITIVMFASGGVGTGGVFLLLLYALVPTLCWILSDEVNLRTILNLIVPGCYNSSSASQYILSKSAIANGGFFGKGLGMGEFKMGYINDISGDFIFCNVCEEFGFLGVLFILVLFFLLAWSGYRCSRHCSKENLFYSNFTTGITTLIVWQFILNVLSVVGIVPISGFSMPFFSEGPQIITCVAGCSLVYKAMQLKKDKDEDLTDMEIPFSENDYDIENR